MTFIILLLVFVAFSMFVVHAVQVRRMAMKGLNTWGHFPAALVRKMSDMAYSISSFMFGGLVIVGITQLIANANSDDVLAKYPGLTWAAIYLFVVLLVYGALWLKNRSIELMK